MSRLILIDAEKLCEYASNQVSGSVSANDIMRFPRVDAEPVKHGYWVTTWNRYDKDGYVIQTRGRCSCCNQYSEVSDYCGNCGARMDEETE